MSSYYYRTVITGVQLPPNIAIIESRHEACCDQRWTLKVSLFISPVHFHYIHCYLSILRYFLRKESMVQV